MKRVAIAAAVLIFGAIFALKLTANKPDAKFPAHFGDAWSTCKGLYHEAKGKDFNDCVSLMVKSYSLFPDGK
jgi:uncharacterized protein (DUF2237 family)